MGGHKEFNSIGNKAKHAKTYHHHNNYITNWIKQRTKTAQGQEKQKPIYQTTTKTATKLVQASQIKVDVLFTLIFGMQCLLYLNL